MPIIIYHYPKCSKSRQALNLLNASNKSFEIIEYLKKPFSPSTLRQIIKQLKVTPEVILRPKEAKEFGINQLVGDALLEALCKYPQAIQRPIIINGNKAIIGRSPEALLSIL